jgi:hypothetical protein
MGLHNLQHNLILREHQLSNTERTPGMIELYTPINSQRQGREKQHFGKIDTNASK